MELVQRVQATAERLFRSFGVKSVTMDDVAKEIAISKKTLYKCFRDKESLVLSTIESHMRENEEAIAKIINTEPNAIEQFHLITKYLMSNQRKMSPSMLYDLKKYHPQSFELLEKHRSKNIVKHLLFNIDLGQKSGLYHNQFHAEIIAKSFSMLSFHVFDSEELIGASSSQDEVLIEIIKYHLRSISTAKGLQTIESIDWNIKTS
ncbi:MAG: TetR/AcrR family transcriptional regulator [Bacteroidia bacterium]|jgi:AcrR family transcriptional regulator|nr:TetR/AcrR family transcriptional regulator [Bacteroidia bacterium]